MSVNCRVEAKRLPHGASRADQQRSLQILLRIFKRACNDAGVMHDYKEHEFFIRPTDKKRRKKMIKRRGQADADAAALENLAANKKKKKYERNEKSY